MEKSKKTLSSYSGWNTRKVACKTLKPMLFNGTKKLILILLVVVVFKDAHSPALLECLNYANVHVSRCMYSCILKSTNYCIIHTYFAIANDIIFIIIVIWCAANLWSLISLLPYLISLNCICTYKRKVTLTHFQLIKISSFFSFAPLYSIRHEWTYVMYFIRKKYRDSALFSLFCVSLINFKLVFWNVFYFRV